MVGHKSQLLFILSSSIMITSCTFSVAQEYQFEEMVPMRDGTEIAADIYLPEDDGPFPVLLQLTPYNKDGQAETASHYTDRGYAVVVADSRGIYGSDGTWTPYVNDGQDGFDLQTWIGEQDWSNGKIGMFGCSYPGFTQLLSAQYANEHLDAIVPECAQSDNYSAIWSTDGIYQIGLVPAWGLNQAAEATGQPRPDVNWGELIWHLPIAEIPELAGVESSFVDDSIQNHDYGHFWEQMSIRDVYDQMDVPALHVVGWYDDLTAETIRNFVQMKEHSASPHAREWQRLLIGPWDHGVDPQRYYGDVDFGPDIESFDMQAVRDRWFDYHLKGEDNGLEDEAPISIFVMGANEWRDEWEWPLERAENMRLYLSSEGFANSLFGNGRLVEEAISAADSDQYEYDPARPTPSYGGHGCCPYVPLAIGPFDQRSIQQREDVLVYTSEILEEDMEITGHPSVQLSVSLDVPDTDFFVTLSDVHPDGTAIPITEGSLRVRYRDSFTDPELLEVDTIEELAIPLWATSNVFKAGHRLRIHVTSSNFPRYARNLNSGGDLAQESADDMQVATPTIYHSDEHQSWIDLPLIPAGSRPN